MDYRTVLPRYFGPLWGRDTGLGKPTCVIRHTLADISCVDILTSADRHICVGVPIFLLYAGGDTNGKRYLAYPCRVILRAVWHIHVGQRSKVSTLLCLTRERERRRGTRTGCPPQLPADHGGAWLQGSIEKMWVRRSCR